MSKYFTHAASYTKFTMFSYLFFMISPSLILKGQDVQSDFLKQPMHPSVYSDIGYNCDGIEFFNREGVTYTKKATDPRFKRFRSTPRFDHINEVKFRNEKYYSTDGHHHIYQWNTASNQWEKYFSVDYEFSDFEILCDESKLLIGSHDTTKRKLLSLISYINKNNSTTELVPFPENIKWPSSLPETIGMSSYFTFQNNGYVIVKAGFTSTIWVVDTSKKTAKEINLSVPSSMKTASAKADTTLRISIFPLNNERLQILVTTPETNVQHMAWACTLRLEDGDQSPYEWIPLPEGKIWPSLDNCFVPVDSLVSE